MTDDQIDTLLDTVERLELIEVSLLRMREFVDHNSEAWTGFVDSQRREWLRYVEILTQIVGAPKALALTKKHHAVQAIFRF